MINNMAFLSELITTPKKRIYLRWFDTLLVHFFKIGNASNYLYILLAKYVSRWNKESKSGSVTSL